jgi:hypothetical protein
VCECIGLPRARAGSIYLSIDLSIDPDLSTPKYTNLRWALTAACGRARQRIDTLEALLPKYVQSGRESSTEAQERALVIVLGLQRGNSAAWASLVRQQFLKSPLYSCLI